MYTREQHGRCVVSGDGSLAQKFKAVAGMWTCAARVVGTKWDGNSGAATRERKSVGAENDSDGAGLGEEEGPKGYRQCGTFTRELVLFMMSSVHAW